MPWKIESDTGTYQLDLGNHVTVPAPDIRGNEKLKFVATHHMDSEILRVYEVEPDGWVNKGSERYIYPTVSELADSLASRGVRVEHIQK